MPTPTLSVNEQLVNTFITDNQSRSSIAALSNGQYVITWQSKTQDGSEYGVYAQVFNADGSTSGGEFRVNSFTTDDQEDPQVVATGNGFIIAWESHGVEDGDGSSVHYRVYFNSGAPSIGPVRFNAITAGEQTSPEMSTSGGNPVVVWTTTSPSNQVMISTLNSSGTNFSDFVLASVTNPNTKAKIEHLSGDLYLVTYGGKAKIWNNATNTAGSEFTTGATSDAEIAVLEDGRFVLTWFGTSGGSSGTDVFFRIFEADGTPVADAATANSYVTDYQGNSEVVALSDGGFLITWISLSQDGDGYGIFAQRFDKHGRMVGDEFQVNTTTTGSQTAPEVTEIANGDIVFSWSSDNQDGSGTGIYTATFTPPVIPPDDEIDGTNGRDTLNGYDGNDTLNGFGGSDWLYGGDDDDRLNGNGGRDRMYGENGNDVLKGGGNTDRLVGGAGNDTLFGGAGDDDMRGGGQHDRLIGGAGNDMLQGAGGRDVFVFASGDGQDTISDFEDVKDRIELVGVTDFASEVTIVQFGTDVLVIYDDITIQIDNESSANITQADFIF